MRSSDQFRRSVNNYENSFITIKMSVSVVCAVIVRHCRLTVKLFGFHTNKYKFGSRPR